MMDVWPLPHITFRPFSSIKESRPVALLTQPSAWAAIKSQVDLPIVVQAEPNRNDREFLDYLTQNLPTLVEVIYVVGDGALLDAAKFIAQANRKPLVILPTAISSDHLFTWTSTVNDNGVTRTAATTSADEVIIDLDVIKSAPATLRAAGIVDVLSIVTALMDWGYAAQKNMTTPETKFVPWAPAISANIASQGLKSAAMIGKGDPDALRMLIDLLCLGVQLDSQLGHRRASHGTEHLFAEAVKLTNSPSDVTYAERVAAGILLTSALYNKDCTGLRTALDAAGIRVSALSSTDISATLNALPDYARQVNAPYSILNDLKANAPELAQALNKSTLIPVAAKPA